MVINLIITHRPIWTGHNTFTAAGTQAFINLNNTGLWVFVDGFWINWTGPHTGRAFTMLTGKRQKIEARLVMMRQPDHPVTIFGWPQTMLGLTRRLTAFATDTTF